jgi:thiol-disulfide isomerase/thioredoxin
MSSFNKELRVGRIGIFRVAIGVLLLSTLSLGDVTLKIGDPAPALRAGKWIKGEPVSHFDAGKVYVIECWATWCGPCRAAIPHVSQLQEKYKDSVIVIGQNMWEHDEDLVAPFVKEMGEKMNYRVVLDNKFADPEGAMATSWMKAAGQNGIPCSFIVDQSGKIAWIGHPMTMAPVLEQVVAGKWDTKAAIAEAEESNRLEAFYDRYNKAIGESDIDGGLKVIDEITSSFPKQANKATYLKFNLLLRTGHFDQAYAMGDDYYEHAKDDADQLNGMAWLIATHDRIKQRDLKLADRLASRAVELTKRDDGNAIDTLARIRFDQGKVDDAVALETEALAKAGADSKDEIAASLEKYKKAKAGN